MTATITVHGGLTSAPELRYSASGVAICSGTVASTDRYLDKQTNEWRDGKKLFARWSAFKDLAEHISASNLDKGAQVVVTGKLHTREYDDRDGVKRSSTELEVIDFAVSLKRATATVTRTQSSGTSQDRAGQPGTSNTGAGDPWATGGAQGGFDSESPF